MNKEYIKPHAQINLFTSEDVITTSGTTIQTPETLAANGYSIGKINSLFK